MAEDHPSPPRDAEITADFERFIQAHSAADRYVLRLYVAGTTPRSAQAVATIRSLCEQYLHGNYDLEVIDLYQQPAEAVGEQIIAAPTLVKKQPMPERRVVGDLSDRDRILVGLDLGKPGSEWTAQNTRWLEV